MLEQQRPNRHSEPVHIEPNADAPVVLGVAGGSGSGKTTLARLLVEALAPCPLIDHDSYYHDQADRSMAERERVNYDHPDALDNELLCRHLEAFRARRGFEKPCYDFATHTRAAPGTPIAAASLAVVEGILVLAHAGVRALMDLRIFVETPEAERRRRRLERDVVERERVAEHVEWQFDHHVQPMHARHVEPSAAHANLTVSGLAPPRENLQRVFDALTPWSRRLDRDRSGIGTRLFAAPGQRPELPDPVAALVADAPSIRLGDPAPPGAPTSLRLIESPTLSQHWPALDRAAGPELQRRISVATRQDGRAVAGWIYLRR